MTLPCVSVFLQFFCRGIDASGVVSPLQVVGAFSINFRVSSHVFLFCKSRGASDVVSPLSVGAFSSSFRELFRTIRRADVSMRFVFSLVLVRA